MATTLRASSKNSATTGTALSVTKPAGTAVGDLMVVITHANTDTTIVDDNGSTPFTEEIDDESPNPGSGHTLSVWSRVIQSGDPSTYKFTSGASGRWSVVAQAWQDPHADKFDIAPLSANVSNEDNYDDGELIVQSITTLTDNAINVVICMWDTGSTSTITHPSGYTAIEVAQDQINASSYKVIGTAGATGDQTYDNNQFAARIGVQFAIKDEGANGITPDMWHPKTNVPPPEKRGVVSY